MEILIWDDPPDQRKSFKWFGEGSTILKLNVSDDTKNVLKKNENIQRKNDFLYLILYKRKTHFLAKVRFQTT